MQITKEASYVLETYVSDGEWEHKATFAEAEWGNDARSMALQAYRAQAAAWPRYNDCIRLRYVQTFSEIVKGF